MCRSDEFNVHAMSVVCLLVSSRGHNIHLIGLIRSDNSALAIHSLVNSWALIEIRDYYYYSWIRLRVRHSSANGAPPQFLPDPSSCDSVLTPPLLCTLHTVNRIFLPSNYKTREISNYLQFRQIVAAGAVVITATGCDYTMIDDSPIRAEYCQALTNQRTACEIQDSPGVILILAPSFGPISTDIKIINCCDI